jgi:hypothetical protein
MTDAARYLELLKTSLYWTPSDNPRREGNFWIVTLQKAFYGEEGMIAVNPPQLRLPAP